MTSVFVLKLANTMINTLIITFSLAFILILFTGGFSVSLFGHSITAHQLINPLGFIFFLALIKYFIHPIFQSRIDRLLNALAGNTFWLMTFMTIIWGLLVFLLLMHKQTMQVSVWNLDNERGYATVFSFLLLMSVASLGAILYIQEKRLHIKLSSLWLPVMLLFSYLALDELASIHEELGAKFIDLSPNFVSKWNHLEWLKLFFPFILLAIVFLIHFSSKKIRTYKLSFLIFFLALGCYILNILSEAIVLEFELRSHLLYQAEVIFEEGCEMLGTSLFMLSFILYYRKNIPHSL